MTAPMDSKFSTFADGGDLVIDDIVVGLRGGINTRFSFQGVPNTYLPLAGGTMLGAIDMNANAIINLPVPSAGGDATNKTYVDASIATAVAGYLPLAGGTMSGIINMGSHKITSLTDPTSAQDAATKAYVDSTGSGTVSSGLINQVAWYASTGTTVSGLATLASGLLVTSAGSVPSISTDIPTAVTIGSAYIYRVGGTDVSVSDGGTGVSSVTAYAVLCGGTTSTGAFQSVSGVGTLNQVLISQGAGALPVWGSVPGVTPAALTKTDDTNVTMTLGGTPTTALLQATSMTLGWTGQLAVGRGGTGLSAITAHNLPIGNGTNALILLAPSATSGVPLISQGAAADPAYGTAVVAGGGTGNTTFTAFSVLCAGTTATGAFQNVSGLGTSGQVLSSQGAGALPQWVTIPGATSAALTKGDDTNVTLTLGGAPTTALLTAASITAGWTGQLSLTRGGSNASLTASNGGMVYSTATTLAILAGTATAGQILRSGATAAPTWSTATYPATAGTSGNVLTSDGTNWLSSTSSNFTQVNIQVFTASGTYTPTANMKYCIAEGMGGGGAGGGVASAIGQASTGAGGGQGNYGRIKLTAAQIGASQTVTIGAGGTVGTAGNNAGNNGGTTSLGTLLTAPGGTGGGGNFNGTPGAGGVAGTSTFSIPGQTGGAGAFVGIANISVPSGYGGGGTASPASTSAANGTAGAANTGAGGSGGMGYNSGTSFTGGAGGTGWLVITEFI